MKVIHTFLHPTQVVEWNEIAKKRGNYVQSAFFDVKYYGESLVYFEVFKNNKLLGGIKGTIWHSKKSSFLKAISKRLSFFGEYIYDDNICRSELKNILEISIKDYIKEHGVVSVSVKGYYGGENIDLKTEQTQSNKVEIAYIDLRKDEEELMNQMHSKHRNVLRKAMKENLNFHATKDELVLINLLKETYKNQTNKQPNYDFIKEMVRNSVDNGFAKIYYAEKDGVVLSAALVHFYGVLADYTFGGNIKNSFGSGQFLQWSIFKELIMYGVERYSLGQVSLKADEKNLKFTEGISKFKLRFGCDIEVIESYEIVVKRIRYIVFNFLKQILLK